MLDIGNWYEREWFRSQRERLSGTSSVYRVPTKEVDGQQLQLVVKNNRFGEDVPCDTHTLAEFINAEFNSPWEEFALTTELRESRSAARANWKEIADAIDRGEASQAVIGSLEELARALESERADMHARFHGTHAR